MIIDDPEVVAEVSAAFDRYNTALITNDVETLTELFADGDKTLRYGMTENLYGAGEIRAFRQARSPVGLERTLDRTVITTYGRDFATAWTLFRRPGSTKVGRQSQVWVRLPDVGWRVVAAHVSLIDEPAKAG